MRQEQQQRKRVCEAVPKLLDVVQQGAESMPPLRTAVYHPGYLLCRVVLVNDVRLPQSSRENELRADCGSHWRGLAGLTRCCSCKHRRCIHGYNVCKQVLHLGLVQETVELHASTYTQT